MSPSFLFTGVKPVFERVFGLSFSDNAEVYDGTMKISREEPSSHCIQLGMQQEVGCSGTWRQGSAYKDQIGSKW